MARYPRRSYGRRGQRRRLIYIASALVVIILVFFMYRSRNTDKKNAPETPVVTEQKSKPTPAPAVVILPEPNLADIPEPAAQPNPKADELITGALALLDESPPMIIQARDRLNETMPMQMSPQQRQFVKQKLSELADAWLFSRRIFPQDKLCGTYKVQSGDLLSSIGKEHKIPYEILMQINNISKPEHLRAGDAIKVIHGPFHARIYRSEFTMDLFLQNTFVRSFPVGLGRAGRETPTGLWVADPGGKLIKPTWTDPDTGRTFQAQDPDYPLGSRWIRLKGLKGDAVGRTGIAFHGTNDPNLIGAAGSRGCIRLHNGDAVLIYNLLIPGFSQVEVVE